MDSGKFESSQAFCSCPHNINGNSQPAISEFVLDLSKQIGFQHQRANRSEYFIVKSNENSTLRAMQKSKPSLSATAEDKILRENQRDG